jgi:hypothetical protein
MRQTRPRPLLLPATPRDPNTGLDNIEASEGKSRREAVRCLKRQLARTVYTTLKKEPLLT